MIKRVNSYFKSGKGGDFPRKVCHEKESQKASCSYSDKEKERKREVEKLYSFKTLQRNFESLSREGSGRKETIKKIKFLKGVDSEKFSHLSFYKFTLFRYYLAGFSSFFLALTYPSFSTLIQKPFYPGKTLWKSGLYFLFFFLFFLYIFLDLSRGFQIFRVAFASFFILISLLKFLALIFSFRTLKGAPYTGEKPQLIQENRQKEERKQQIENLQKEKRNKNTRVLKGKEKQKNSKREMYTEVLKMPERITSRKVSKGCESGSHDKMPEEQDWLFCSVLVPLFQEEKALFGLINSLSELDYPRHKLEIKLLVESQDLQTYKNLARLSFDSEIFEIISIPDIGPRTKPKALNFGLFFCQGEIVVVFDAEDRPEKTQIKAAIRIFMEQDKALKQEEKREGQEQFLQEKEEQEQSLQEKDKEFLSEPTLSFFPTIGSLFPENSLSSKGLERRSPGRGSGKLAYIQAPLVLYNTEHNQLTRQFALEYSAHFYVFLPFLGYFFNAFPLGGTSNYIRMQALKAAGGWDAFNVTEDADLGMRLTSFGWEGRMLEVPTKEEAPLTLNAWLMQRSRWQKGALQTWWRHSGFHRGVSVWKQGKAFFLTQITMGMDILSSLLYTPVFLFFSGLLVLAFFGISPIKLPVFDISLFVIGSFIALAFNAIGALRAKKAYLVTSLWITPFYWLLRFPSLLVALYSLVTQPYYWKKTEHLADDDPQRPLDKNM